MKKLKFAAIASPLVLVAPIALASCGTDNGNPNPEVGMTDQQARDAFRATVAKNGDLGRYKAFNPDGKATDAVIYYDILARVYNDDQTDGIINNLTIAENFYNDGKYDITGGSVKPKFDAKIFPALIDTNADSEKTGIKQSLTFDAQNNFEDANAFKSWKVDKTKFENDYSIVRDIHNQIKQIVDGDKQNKYMLYVPRESKNNEFGVFLFKKKATSQKIVDAWNYFKDNFEVSMDSLSVLHSTYILQPTERFAAIEKEEWKLQDVKDDQGNVTGQELKSTYISDPNKAPLHGDFKQKESGFDMGLDRSSGDNMHANFAIKFKGTDSEWTNTAMKTLSGVTFNISWIRDEKTYEEKLRVSIMENGSQDLSVDGDTTPSVDNMETFIFDGKDVMRFADIITKPLDIWKSSKEPIAVKNAFSYNEDKLFKLINSKSFSYNGLTDMLYGLQSMLSMLNDTNALEARTQIADLYAVLAKTNANNYNLQDRATFDKFLQWVKSTYPNFGFKTLQLIFEQLDGVELVGLPTPLTHYELALTSQLYGMMIKFFEDPVNASLRPQQVDIQQIKNLITDDNAKLVAKEMFSTWDPEFINYVDSLQNPKDFENLMIQINKVIPHDVNNKDFALDQKDKDTIQYNLITSGAEARKIVKTFFKDKAELEAYIDAHQADSNWLISLKTQLTQP